MYEVIITNNSTNTIIYYPSSDPDTPHLNKLNKKEKDSNADILDFTILKDNPGYDILYELTTEVTIKDIRDDTYEFDGRIIKVIEKMDSNGMFYKDVTVEGSLDYLLDSSTRKYTYELKTPTEILTDLLNKHNSKVSSNRQIHLGNIEITNATTISVNYQTTLAAIQLIKGKLGGHFKIRLQNGVRYLDYFNTINTDIVIRLGENMKDMLIENDITGMGTRLIPIGKDDLTIEYVNNGLDYIDNPTAIAKYGIIEKPVQYNDIEDATQLKAQMLNDLDKHSQPKQTLESSALDMSVFSNTSIDEFTICKNVEIINPVMAIDTIYEIVELDKDLLKPYNPKLTISNTPDNLTDAIVTFNNTTSLVNSITTSDGQVNTYKLDGAINVLKNQLVASAAFSNVQVVDDKGLLLENTDAQSDDYGALYLGPGIFAIANSKDANGNWNWRSFGTGKGFTANELVTGILKNGDGSSYFNLETGQFKLGNQLLFDGTNLTFGNGVDVIDQNELNTTLSDYINTGKLTDALVNTLTTSNFMTTITKDYIASMNLIVGKEILMGANAIINWATQVDNKPFIPSTAADVGARSITWTPTPDEVGALSNTSPRITKLGSDGLYTGTVDASKVVGNTFYVTDFIQFMKGTTKLFKIGLNANANAGQLYLNDTCSLDTNGSDMRMKVADNNYIRVNSGGGFDYYYPTGTGTYNVIPIVDGSGNLQTGTGSSITVNVVPKFG
jgi:hypothetical protein